MSSESISRERLEATPDEVYVESIKEPVYEFKKQYYFDHLIETNRAWTVMLAETDIIPEEEASELLEVFNKLSREGPDTLGKYNPEYEYFYSHMEQILIEELSEDLAGNINIGRTRPEPLARMVTRERILRAVDLTTSLREVLIDIAEDHVETVMPQWTHFQHAQISTVGHYMLAIADELGRDTRRLLDSYNTVNKCTLGCGALAGASYPLDRQLVADLLGFDGYKENTIGCVSGGDHLMEPSAAMANMMTTLSRFCQDNYIWHTWEFDFVEIGDQFCGSSSMMPQKKNPYIFESIRARAGQTIADTTSVYETLHNTNFQDIKDVEEEAVYPLFNAFERTGTSLELLTTVMSSAEFEESNMLQKATEGFASCTELASKLHRETEFSYRTTHRIVGKMVLRALNQGLDASEVDAEIVNEAARAVIDQDLDIDDEFVHEALDPELFVRSHDVPGGPSPQVVRRMIADRRAEVDNQRTTLTQRREDLETAANELDEYVADLTT